MLPRGHRQPVHLREPEFEDRLVEDALQQLNIQSQSSAATALHLLNACAWTMAGSAATLASRSTRCQRAMRGRALPRAGDALGLACQGRNRGDGVIVYGSVRVRAPSRSRPAPASGCKKHTRPGSESPVGRAIRAKTSTRSSRGMSMPSPATTRRSPVPSCARPARCPGDDQVRGGGLMLARDAPHGMGT